MFEKIYTKKIIVKLSDKFQGICNENYFLILITRLVFINFLDGNIKYLKTRKLFREIWEPPSWIN